MTPLERKNIQEMVDLHKGWDEDNIPIGMLYCRKLLEEIGKLESDFFQRVTYKRQLRDAESVIGVMLKRLGGKFELRPVDILDMENDKNSVVTWDDVISGAKVFMLQTMTTSSEGGDANGDR